MNNILAWCIIIFSVLFAAYGLSKTGNLRTIECMFIECKSPFGVKKPEKEENTDFFSSYFN